MSATDFTVKTGNPKALDATVQALPGTAAAVVDGSFNPAAKTAVVRVFGNTMFFKFAMKNQGYGEIVAEEPVDE